MNFWAINFIFYKVLFKKSQWALCLLKKAPTMIDHHIQHTYQRKSHLTCTWPVTPLRWSSCWKIINAYRKSSSKKANCSPIWKQISLVTVFSVKKKGLAVWLFKVPQHTFTFARNLARHACVTFSSITWFHWNSRLNIICVNSWLSGK